MKGAIGNHDRRREDKCHLGGRELPQKAPNLQRVESAAVMLRDLLCDNVLNDVVLQVHKEPPSDQIKRLRGSATDCRDIVFACRSRSISMCRACESRRGKPTGEDTVGKDAGSRRHDWKRQV
jgi:hypothetical protein